MHDFPGINIIKSHNFSTLDKGSDEATKLPRTENTNRKSSIVTDDEMFEYASLECFMNL